MRYTQIHDLVIRLKLRAFAILSLQFNPFKFTMCFQGLNRVAIFFLVQDPQAGKTMPNEQKMYQIVIKYPKYP
jgi:hypothetical protein